jgi:hypothetical protein
MDIQLQYILAATIIGDAERQRYISLTGSACATELRIRADIE